MSLPFPGIMLAAARWNTPPRRLVGWMAVLVASVFLAGCRTAATATKPPVLRPETLAAIDTAILDAIASNRCPGGVVWLEHDGALYVRPYGRQAVEPLPEPTTTETVYDAASLTKVLATTPAVMKLVEQELLDPEAPVAKYLPAFAANGKESITVRHLLTHTSGLRPGLGAGNWTGADEAIRRACSETPTQAPGTKFVYSDINFIVLGHLVELVSGTPLQAFCEREFYRPLGMRSTGYLPLPRIPMSRIAPTERQPDGGVLRGVVHDPTARRMGGVAGHAGIFTTAEDVARFCRMMLDEGRLGHTRVLKPGTVRRMIAVQSPEGLPKRGFGWDIDSPYAGPRGNLFPVGSYGHSGWTGTSLWIDPASRTFIIFLSNRNHPTEDGNVIALRRRLGTLAAEAINPSAEPPAR